jgi:hypothetical protein
MFQVDEDPDLRSEGERSTFTIMIPQAGTKVGVAANRRENENGSGAGLDAKPSGNEDDKTARPRKNGRQTGFGPC